MDKPSKRRLAKSTLSLKEDMESELNRKLPKLDSRVPAQSALLTEEGFAPVEVQSSPAPTFDGTSNIELQGFYPDEGYDYGIMGRATRVTKPPAPTAHWSTTRKQTPRLISGITRNRQSAQTAGYMGAYSAPFSDPAHEAEAFVRPSTTRRERARHLRRSIASSAWSDNRRHLLPLRWRLRRSYTRLSARVSFIPLFH